MSALLGHGLTQRSTFACIALRHTSSGASVKPIKLEYTIAEGELKMCQENCGE